MIIIIQKFTQNLVYLKNNQDINGVLTQLNHTITITPQEISS